MPILSIITINRNNAEGLKKTITSVVSQLNVDFNKDCEYIIIDGASNDDSVDVIRSFKSNPEYKDRITYWISESDTGIYNAINKGIKIANANYLHILNSGDYYEPDALSTIIKNLRKNMPDLLMCAVNLWKNNCIQRTELRTENVLSESAILHQGIFYKKEFHQQYGLYNEEIRYASDYDFCVKAFYNKDLKINYIYNPLINFILGGVGETDISVKEFLEIQVKNNFIEPPKKRPFIIKLIKLFIPYGILLLKEKIICKIH